MLKVAVPVNESDQIEDHFGKCEFYEIYTLDDENELVSVEVLPSVQGCGCKSDIAEKLTGQGVSVMLAGGIGQGAINKLSASGIEVVRGCNGSASEAVKLFASGLLKDNGVTCDHHEHHHQ